MVMNWTHVLIHHSAGPDTDKVERDAYRKQHKAKGWQDIGYHSVAEKVDGIYRVMPGRPETMQGSHCPGMNSKALGICLAGNFSLATPPLELLRVAAEHVANWCEKYSIPVENIHRHSDHRSTECPGTKFNIESFRALVRQVQ